jgi:hypothetical protein
MIGNAFIDRRKFLQLGALGGVLVAAGCGGDDSPQAVTTPPVEGGNRKFLEKIKETADSKIKKK